MKVYVVMYYWTGEFGRSHNVRGVFSDLDSAVKYCKVVKGEFKSKFVYSTTEGDDFVIVPTQYS